jgi:predicted nucleic acid-binding protein
MAKRPTQFRRSDAKPRINEQKLLDTLATVAEPVRLAYLWRPTLPDVDDDMVLEAAVNGRADGIVTFNLSDFIGPAKQFGIEIVRPGEAVQLLEEKP